MSTSRVPCTCARLRSKIWWSFSQYSLLSTVKASHKSRKLASSRASCRSIHALAHDRTTYSSLLQYHSIRKKWLKRACTCMCCAFFDGRVRSMHALQNTPLRQQVVYPAYMRMGGCAPTITSRHSCCSSALRGFGMLVMRPCTARTAMCTFVTPAFISTAQGSPASLHLHRCRRNVPCPITS